MTIENDIIQMLLPHRYPFLLLDRVIDLKPGKSAVGIKNVTINEPYFQGHFPTEPIVPGVLLLESLAQLTAVMYCSEYFDEDTQWDKVLPEEIAAKDIASKVGYLAEIKSVKFKSLVKPGDQLRLQVIKKNSFNNLSLIAVSAYVDKICVLEGQMSVSQKG
ncbi:MAG: 3-hydroxyacyl-ACP dehydratase FabZ [Lachnospiraceae bacterium]|nr:3-hydroxyacyl-ACP dehydratase FabZ [Lachnospiraceae bacterium]